MILWNNIVSHQFVSDLDHCEVMYGRRVLIQIHHDQIYPRQSRATAKIWNGDEWKLASSYDFDVWARDGQQGEEGFPTNGMQIAFYELIARVVALLDPKFVEER